ncbi:MAG: hypothetical protein J7L37_09420 [Thermococcus sp.]|nr:hypothetical protein [Thermococcus sp.]
MEETLVVMQKAYRKSFAAGMFLLLAAFALIIWQPFGRTASLVAGMILFAVAFIPLEMARRIARDMALAAMRENRKA